MDISKHELVWGAEKESWNSLLTNVHSVRSAPLTRLEPPQTHSDKETGHFGSLGGGSGGVAQWEHEWNSCAATSASTASLTTSNVDSNAKYRSSLQRNVPALESAVWAYNWVTPGWYDIFNSQSFTTDSSLFFFLPNMVKEGKGCENGDITRLLCNASGDFTDAVIG